MKSIQPHIHRQTKQAEFILRGLAARDETRQTGKYVSAEEILAELERALAKSNKVSLISQSHWQ
jgi:predicted transcriptional regulator